MCNIALNNVYQKRLHLIILLFSQSCQHFMYFSRYKKKKSPLKFRKLVNLKKLQPIFSESWIYMIFRGVDK